MRQVSAGSRFRKDVRLASRRGKDLGKLRAAIDLLMSGQTLPPNYRDHPLKGDFMGYRDCHLEPDWLLIYSISENGLFLLRTGSHADLFG